jgi:small-conductance mechanosensitive channel
MPLGADCRRIPECSYAEANMTVTNVIEAVVVLAILYVAYRFFQKRG